MLWLPVMRLLRPYVSTGRRVSYWVGKSESFSVSWGYISLGLGQTRWLFKRNSKTFTGFGFTPKPIPPLPRLDWQATLVKHLTLCHFDFYCLCSYLPLLLLGNLIQGKKVFISLAQCCGPLECEKLWLSGEANSLMLPILLRSMSSSLCFPFWGKYWW